VNDRTRRRLARLAAPAAFLAAATIAILSVRAAIHDEPSAGGTRPAATAPAPTTTRSPAPAPRSATTRRAPRFVRVGPGDTLGSIAEQHRTTVENLRALNPDVDPVALTVGQRIRVR
jgi:hypothetical protein